MVPHFVELVHDSLPKSPLLLGDMRGGVLCYHSIVVFEGALDLPVPDVRGVRGTDLCWIVPCAHRSMFRSGRWYGTVIIFYG